MIDVERAKELILENAYQAPTEQLGINEANMRVLSEDVVAPIDHPIFDQTAIDGYAVRFEDISKSSALEVIGEVQAGSTAEVNVTAGTAVRIFTGGTIPSGANTAVMQEYVEHADGKIMINDPGLKLGSNIRRKGEQLKEGEIALPKGAVLNPASIGLLGSLGIEQVVVAELPKVGVMVTGDEFAEPGTQLKEGQIYESNGVMLASVLKEMSIRTKPTIAVDDENVLNSIFQKEIAQNDIVIITGGVSVGDYDFTREVIEKNGFEIIFHKVAQKPGKPILFARKDNQLVFGLPGNPRAVLLCYYEYVLPCIKAMMGSKTPFPKQIHLLLAADFQKKEGRAQFLAGKFVSNGIVPLSSQESHMLKSLSEAEGIIFLPAGVSSFPKGTMVEVHFIKDLN